MSKSQMKQKTRLMMQKLPKLNYEDSNKRYA